MNTNFKETKRIGMAPMIDNSLNSLSCNDVASSWISTINNPLTRYPPSRQDRVAAHEKSLMQ